MTKKTQHKAGKQTHVECRKGLSSYSLCQLYLYPQLVNACWRLSYELCLILIWQSESHRGASRLVGLYSAAVRQLTPSHQRRARLHVGRFPGDGANVHSCPEVKIKAALPWSEAEREIINHFSHKNPRGRGGRAGRKVEVLSAAWPTRHTAAWAPKKIYDITVLLQQHGK